MRLLHQFVGTRSRLITTTGCAVVLATGGIAAATTIPLGNQQVGSTYASGLQISDDQTLQPLGQRLMTPFGKIMGSAVSPDGHFLAATSADRSVDVQIFDLRTYKPVAAAGTLSTASFATAATNAGFAGLPYQHITDGSIGQAAPTFSPDGTALYVAVATGIIRYPVNPNGTLGTGTTITIPTVNNLKALTGGITVAPDGTVYAAVNGQNTVVAIDPVAGTIKQTWSVGIAPRGVVLVGSKLYVTNEGGRTAQGGDVTMGSYGTQVPADPYLGTSTTGTVSVIDTATAGAPVGSISVGVHPTSAYAHGDAVYVANTNADTVSVINTKTDKVVQTINTQPWSGSEVGYQPTGLTVTQGHLLVTLSRANAVADYALESDPQAPVRYVGLLPTDYYPTNVAGANGQIVVTNTRGIDARGPLLTFNKGIGTLPATGHGTHGTTASLTRFALPADAAVEAYTARVFTQNGWTGSDVKQSHGGSVPAVAVPRRIGDPSTIKHVFLLVKENRTYDQVYGDMAEGNGDPTLAQFGQKATPNQHALASQFGLYDNLYDVGTNSAEGHNWLMQGDNPNYTESSAGEYTRSYDTEEDVLGHQRSGFLWTSVESAGATARNFGEFEYGEGKPAGSTWQQYYCAATGTMAGGDPAQLTAPGLLGNYGSQIPSLNAISVPAAPPFDTSIPDIYRSQIWKQNFLKNGPANFNMVWLSSDHTGGTADPEAQVADNDMAVGQIVDTISHSSYWKDSVIFVIEDDSQDGADHVDGHRGPVQVISPWAQHGKVIDTYYSQISVVRTIEQILGAQPLNQKVAAATPMYDAFTRKPDYTPFNAVRNQVPLTEGVATTPTCGNDTLGLSGPALSSLNARVAAATYVPPSMRSVAAAWAAWAAKQHLSGSTAQADDGFPQLMNRWTWYQQHQWSLPYPGDKAILRPSQVSGASYND